MIYRNSRGFESFRCKYACSKALAYRDLVATVKTALLTEHLPELEAKLKNGDGESITIQTKLIERLEKQMQELKAQEAKQYDLLETGIYTNDVFLERNAAVREKITACSNQIAEAKKNLPNAINYEEKIITLKEAIAAIDDDTIPVEKKNILMKSVIKRMEYTSERGQSLGVNDFTLSITLNI